MFLGRRYFCICSGCVWCICTLKYNVLIRNCQSWLFITEHGQFKSSKLGLYWARWQSDLENTQKDHLYKPSQDQRKSTAVGGAWKFAERCIHFHNYVEWRLCLHLFKTTVTTGPMLCFVCMFSCITLIIIFARY